MKNYLIKIFSIIGVIFISFFINKLNVRAVDKCVWHTYESGIYYDSSSKTYKPVEFSAGMPMAYKLTYDSSKKKTFTFSGSGKTFKSDKGDDFKNYLKNASTCPEYISVSYKRMGSNGYKILNSTQSLYKNYIQNVYGTNFTMLPYGNEAYGAVEHSGFLDSVYNMEENDDNSKSAKPIYYTSKESKYSEKTIKLEKYNKDLKSQFEKKLSGLADKGKDYNYKEDFYESTNVTWSAAIKSIKSELKSNCSAYKNDKSNNREVYLDLLDHDMFPKMLESNYIASYNDSEYKNKIPNEKCYNTVVKAMYMQVSFSKWWELVDWLSLTKVDNANGDIDKFYDYYEFAHLYTDGGLKVRPVYDALVQMKKGNVGIDNNNKLSDDECSALCHDYNPAYKSTGSSSAYSQCMNSTGVKDCKTAQSKCKSKTFGIGDSNSAKTAYDQCMKTEMGDDKYQKMQDTIEEMKNDNNQTIASAAQGMVDTLSRVDAPDFKNITFDPHYTPKCEDYEELHNIYNILRIIAPILVILFGTLDYAKAVIASDIEKMEKSKKNFPKRLLLLVLFIIVPFIVSFLISTFSSTNITVARCVVNGS